MVLVVLAGLEELPQSLDVAKDLVVALLVILLGEPHELLSRVKRLLHSLLGHVLPELIVLLNPLDDSTNLLAAPLQCCILVD